MYTGHAAHGQQKPSSPIRRMMSCGVHIYPIVKLIMKKKTLFLSLFSLLFSFPLSFSFTSVKSI